MKNIAQKRREALRRAFDESGETQTGICRRAGVAEATVRLFLKGKTQTMQVDTYDKLSVAMKKPVTFLLGELETMPAQAPSPTLPQPNVDIPIRQAVASGQEGEVKMKKTSLIGHYQRPATPLDNKDAFAFYMPDDSMAPLFYTGDIVEVDPMRPPNAGRPAFVVFSTDDSDELHGMVAILIKLGLAEIELRQLNPDRVYHIDGSRAKGVWHAWFAKKP